MLLILIVTIVIVIAVVPTVAIIIIATINLLPFVLYLVAFMLAKNMGNLKPQFIGSTARARSSHTGGFHYEIQSVRKVLE